MHAGAVFGARFGLWAGKGRRVPVGEALVGGGRGGGGDRVKRDATRCAPTLGPPRRRRGGIGRRRCDARRRPTGHAHSPRAADAGHAETVHQQQWTLWRRTRRRVAGSMDAARALATLVGPEKHWFGPDTGPKFVLRRRESGGGAHEGLRFALGIRTHSPPLMIKMAAACVSPAIADREFT